MDKLLDSIARNRNKPLNWSTSIVDLMKLFNLDSQNQRRIQLARKLDFKGDVNNSFERNTWLLGQLKNILLTNHGTLPAEFNEWDVVSLEHLSM